MKEADLTLEPRLAAIADCLIPASGGMPAATEVEVTKLMNGKLRRYRPDLVETVCEIIRRDSALSPQVFVERLATGDPQGFQRLFEAVAGAYYLSPIVRRRIGYPGQEALQLPRAGIGVEDLLEKMLDMPKLFRQVPGEDI